MGKLILRNNGLETQLINGVAFSGITPQNNTYYIGVDSESGLFSQLNPSGTTINIGSGGANTNYVAYSELVNSITGGTLDSGSFYLITDFQTCYDQPDFDYNGNPITTGNYKQGPVEPILVLATSANTISEIAYQPAYPKDRILYDWSWNMTEVTSGQTFGRITERIDEFNNRTDYDHRNILFKRYKLFTYRQDQPLNGTIELLSGGTVNGTNTSFTGLTVGDVIYIPTTNPSFYEILTITSDTEMTVSGDTISDVGPGQEIYKAIEETNDINGYFSYTRTNVKTWDFVEYTTFGNAISESYAKNTYVGNYANNYQNVSYGAFILANNVFLEGQYESNKFGDYCYNNTFGTDNTHNIWGDWCYENVSTNDIDNNIIGHYFNRNLINANLFDNHIGNDFKNNRLLGENGDENDFQDNIIGNGFENNLIYSEFYKNEILDNFSNNIIGDFGNLYNFGFYRNYIRNNFNNNIIRQDFQNNQIGTNFQSNEINGEFIGNTILNGFNNNTTGYYFGVNNIGNGFNNNTIYDGFYYNTTGYYFNDNVISNDFNSNNIGTYFQNNGPTNLDLFGWDDLSTVSTRTYDTFLNSVGGGGLGNKVVGKDFVMRVISTSQYFTIKFTQWTQNANGGGFQYERQEIDSSGNNIGSPIIFTKTNYGSEVDIIVAGVVEITRGTQNGIYNIVTESSWNGSVSPEDTEWNSIYTQSNNGERFGYNKIGNNFRNNIIDSDFGYGGGDPYGNVILDDFNNNVIGQYMYNNTIGNYFTNNIIGINFENNTIKNYFRGNSISDNFEGNQIGDYFGNTGTGTRNTILNNFRFNVIGNYFGNDANYISVNDDGGNIVGDNFEYNTIGNNVIFNAFGSINFSGNKIGDDLWFNIFNSNTTDNVIGNLFVGNTGVGGYPTVIGGSISSNSIGNYFAFNEIGGDFMYNTIGNFFGNAGIGTQNVISSVFTNNSVGNYFGDDSSNTSGGNSIVSSFYDNIIGSYFYDNQTGSDFYNNVVNNYFNTNSISGSFTNNNIGIGFANNSVGDVFQNNTTNNGFENNTIGSFFQLNKMESYLSGIDFTSNPATHVYGDYNCTLFKRSDGTLRLSYYDATDVLNIVNIDA